MKPDDIINAVGDVDEMLVKRAHRKDLLKAFCAFLAVFGVLAFLSGFLMEQDYVLARYQPNGQPNTGYVDPMHLEKAKWTTMEHISFQNGEEINTTVFARHILGGYTITHTEAGNETLLVGRAGRLEYLESIGDDNLYMESSYSYDLIGRVDYLRVRGEQKYPGGSQLLNLLSFEYLQSLWMNRQNKMDDSGIVGYRTIDHQNKKISATKDYDANDVLLAYTEYVYDGLDYEAVSYDADGTRLGHINCRTDLWGRVKYREYFDAEGNLTQREVYRYRFWECYRGIAGFAVLFVTLSLSTLIGVSVYDDRIQLPKRSRKVE